VELPSSQADLKDGLTKKQTAIIALLRQDALRQSAKATEETVD
jgi:hypothetical protein